MDAPKPLAREINHLPQEQHYVRVMRGEISLRGAERRRHPALSDALLCAVHAGGE